MMLRGLFRLLCLYDVAESIDLPRLRDLLGSRGSSGPAFPRRTPGYVRFEEAPIVEPAEFITVCPGVSAACPVKYYGFGAIVVQVELPFELEDWHSLVAQGSRWMDAPDIEPCVRDLARRRLDAIRSAISRPTEDWLQETYLVVEIHEIREAGGAQPSADEVLTAHGEELVQLIRGETTPLASKFRDESLQSVLSYYPSDLVLVGSHGAVVYDSPEDATAVTQILEYAQMQLPNFATTINSCPGCWRSFTSRWNKNGTCWCRGGSCRARRSASIPFDWT